MNAKGNIIEQAVSKLKKFGFLHVNADNIMRDEVYRYYFEKILREEAWKNTERDAVIDELLREIKSDRM
ncbi:MAG TPA: hypothetical protein VE978_19455 [Chitinophagales bacterium]|nr:hypothetical protein [Chitinophagales bacterium]